MDTPDDGSSQDLAEVIARWQERLLDLTKRNRLLYFRSGRSAVRLTSHTPDQISEELLGQASGLSFDYAERRQTRKPIFVDPLSDEVEVADLEPDVVKGALDTDCEVFDLQRRLKLLQRQDTEWEQEQGINVLFLESSPFLVETIHGARLFKQLSSSVHSSSWSQSSALA